MKRQYSFGRPPNYSPFVGDAARRNADANAQIISQVDQKDSNGNYNYAYVFIIIVFNFYHFDGICPKFHLILAYVFNLRVAVVHKMLTNDTLFTFVRDAIMLIGWCLCV